MSFHYRNPNVHAGVGILTTLVLGVVLAMGPVGCGDSAGVVQPSVIKENLSPFFQGVQSVITAGGDRILVNWKPATDDFDDPDDLRYRVYLATTSDGFDFTAPAWTTGAGETSVQLIGSRHPEIKVGDEVFVAVRALDTDGAEDLNAVECAVTCVHSDAVVYVRPGAAVQGTVGDPLDPFGTIQQGIDAVPASGGIVLVAGGVYDEIVVVDRQAQGVIGIFGAFNAADFVAGTTPERLLDGNDLSHPTILDGDGTDPGTEMAHFNVHNEGRRTYVSRFQFRRTLDANYLFGAYSVNLVLSESEFVGPDPNEDAALWGAILIQEDDTNVTRPSFDLVGGTFREIFDTILVNIGAPMARLRVSTCVVEDCDDFLDARPEIPPGATFDFRFEGNWVARLDGWVAYVIPAVLQEDQLGDSDIRIQGNRLVGVGDGIMLEEFARHGSGGKLDVLVERNFIGPSDGTGLEFFYLYHPGSGPVDPLAPDEINVTLRENNFSNIEDIAIEFDEFRPGPDSKTNILIEDSAFVGLDEEIIYGYERTYGATEFSQDRTEVKTVMRDLRAISAYQFVDWTQRVYRGGKSTVEVRDSIAEGMSDDYGIEVELRRFATEVTELTDDSAPTVLRVTDNVLTMGYDYEAMYLQQDVRGEGNVFDVSRNGIIASYDATEIDIYFPESQLAQNGRDAASFEFFFDGNVIEVAENDYGLEVDFYDNGPADVFMRIANNRFRVPEYAVYFSSSNDSLRGFLYLANNSILGTYSDDATEINLNAGEWTVLAARNLIQGGGIGGDDGLSFDIQDSVRGADVIVRNNIVAHLGEGIEFQDDVLTGQLYNNTVAFIGSGDEDAPIGVNEGGGVNAPLNVMNCVSHGNMLWDVEAGIVPFFTCVGKVAGEVGYGCVEADPVFQRHGSLEDANSWFQLSPASPAVDAGDPDPDYDDPDGTRNDLGAFGGPGAGLVGFTNDPTDKIPFVIIGLDPMVDLYAGAHLIDGATPLTVLFSEPLDATTVTAATLSFVVDGAALPGTYMVDGRRVTFTPEDGWPAGAEVHLVATTDLLATTGETLDFRHGRWFATAPATRIPEMEPNDTPQTAMVLNDTAKTFDVDGFMDGGDSDFYRLTATVGTRLQVSLFAARLDGFDGGLRLYAADGTTVLFDNSWALPGGDPFIDFMLPATGVYYVEVYGEEGEGEYDLEIWRFMR